MRAHLAALATAALLIAPVSAYADDPAAPAPKKEKKVCRQIMTTGSIAPLKRVCLTEAEWVQVDTAIAPINARGVDRVMGNVQPKGGTP